MTPAMSAASMNLVTTTTDPLKAHSQAVELMLEILDATGHGNAAASYRFGIARRFEDWTEEATDAIAKEWIEEVEALRVQVKELKEKLEAKP